MSRTAKTKALAPVAQPAAEFTPDVVISAPQQLDIQITLDGLTIGDLKLFAALEAGTASNMALVELLDRCVVGGVDHLPLTAISQVAQALAAALKAANDPKN